MKVNKMRSLTHDTNLIRMDLKMSFSQKTLTNYYNDKNLKG